MEGLAYEAELELTRDMSNVMRRCIAAEGQMTERSLIS